MSSNVLCWIWRAAERMALMAPPSSSLSMWRKTFPVKLKLWFELLFA